MRMGKRLALLAALAGVALANTLANPSEHDQDVRANEQTSSAIRGPNIEPATLSLLALGVLALLMRR